MSKQCLFVCLCVWICAVGACIPKVHSFSVGSHHVLRSWRCCCCCCCSAQEEAPAEVRGVTALRVDVHSQVGDKRGETSFIFCFFCCRCLAVKWGEISGWICVVSHVSGFASVFCVAYFVCGFLVLWFVFERWARRACKYTNKCTEKSRSFELLGWPARWCYTQRYL